MHYFKLLVATLLVGASLANGAANPRADADGACHFDAADGARLVQIIQEGDDPAPLTEILEGCNGLVFNQHAQVGLHEMIRLRRHTIFNFLLPRIEFRVQGFSRAQVLYGILGLTLGSNSIEIADLLLAQGALSQRRAGSPLWIAGGQGVWSVDELRELIDRHRDHATELSPTAADMSLVETEGDARVLVALAQHCHGITGLQGSASYLTDLLRAVLSYNHHLEGDGLAQIALLLFQEGAELNEKMRERFAEGHPEAYQMFEEWVAEEVKEPEFS